MRQLRSPLARAVPHAEPGSTRPRLCMLRRRLAATAVQRHGDFALGAAVSGHQFEQRHRRDGLVQNLSQGVDGGEAHAQAGERSRAGHYDKGINVGLGESVILKQGCNCGTSCAENMPPASGTTSSTCTVSLSAARARATVPFLPEVSVMRRSICVFVAVSVMIRQDRCPESSYPCTSSSSTLRCLRDGRRHTVSPAPVLISSETRRTPSFLSRSTAAGKSGTFRQTWCRPSPRWR